MCDTLVALGNATDDGSVIFAKNSDRETNEVHEIVYIPRKKYTRDNSVRCTYITIPQVKETNAILLAKPFWIWGAEMGANEHGVVIGNEGLFTKVEYDKNPGLIGMDFLRLALERADSAFHALKVITNLLQIYNQGGNCGFSSKQYYHNSFLIADVNDAWVLETAGRQWAAKQVKDVYSISNRITIDQDWDLSSENLVKYAIERRWCKNKKEFNFSRCYSDNYATKICYAKARNIRAAEMLNLHKGKINIKTMMSILRDHGSNDRLRWMPTRELTGLNICMHIGCGPIKKGQTTGSMVSHLNKNIQTHWVTGTAAPCTGVFKPVWIGSDLPANWQSSTGKYDKNNIWWLHERLNRAVMLDYQNRVNVYKVERDALENRFIENVKKIRTDSGVDRTKYMSECLFEAKVATEKWTEQIMTLKTKNRIPLYYIRKMNILNKKGDLSAIN